VLEVSLRKAGFSVTPAVSVGDALDKLEVNAPDLIISETKFATDLDGFELRRRLRNMPEWAEIPFIFLTAETAIENKIKGLELGVDDYLTKPIYIKEIVTRINILLQKRQRQFLDLRKDGTRFAGRVADMPVVDVIQTIEVSRKSGVIQFTGVANRQAAIYFRDGKVIDAEAGTLQGEDAVYRLLTWSDGEFEVEFRTVRRREVINASSQGLLMEGMRRLDEWSRLLEQLPPLSHRFEIDANELSGRLGEVPDDNNRILRLFDGKRTLLEVIDSSDFGDLECLQAVSRLYFEGLLIDLDPSVRTKRETGKPGPLVMVDDAPSPMEKAASGPIDLRRLESRAAGNAEPVAPAPAAEPVTPAPVEAAPAPKAGSLTMGWDAQPDPTQAAPAPVEAAPAPKAGSLTMGWDAQPDPTESAPLASPAELAAEAPRARRDSGVQIDDQDVVGEEEVHGPLSGGYRPSSLRLIDEAVAAAQLIEPSLFEPEELARLGIKPKAAEETSTAATEEAAAVARVKAELTTSDPSIELKRDTLETPVAVAPDEAAAPPEAAAPVTPRVTAASTPPPMPPNGTLRERKKTVPPPVPRAPAKVSPRLEDVPMLDSNLLTSGEHKIPDTADLDDETPLIDVDLLTSGEFKIPTAAQLAASLPTATPGEPAKAMPVIRVPLPDDSDGAPAPEPDDYSGVPTVIEAENDDDDGGGDVGGPTNLELPSRRNSQPMKREDSQAVRMIGSYGKDRAEAAGELRPPSTGRASTEPGVTQRELVTILPRRKTGEITQLRAEDLAAKQAEAADATKPGKNGASSNAEAVKDAQAAGKAEAKADAKPDAKAEAKADAKPETNAAKPAAKTDAKAKPAVEPPATPARRVSVEGGVVAPARGPGRGAQILIALASLLAAGTVFTVCRKDKPAQKPVAEVRDDAALVVEGTPDAIEYSGFGMDAGMAAAPRDAGALVHAPADAATVVQAPRDAATVVQAPLDAATVAVATADAGIDKAKEARILFDKAHSALEDGDADQALELLDQSLKLRRQARTLLERARALQRLRRIDEAIASIDDAIKMNDSYAPAWEQKGTLLWSEKKYSEARPALEMYLQLAPDGARAATIRSMLDEPR
jgi:DNA-binding response OmpR family regulator/tetratricopeptide (TPR) repeat protein